MRDFDAERPSDLTFKIGGETFTMLLVPPEVLAEWEDARAAELADQRAKLASGEAIEDTPDAAARSIAITDQRIKSFLDPSDHARYDKVRAKAAGDPDVIPYGALVELKNWMVETQSARPTQTPSPSGGGRGRTGRSSRAASRSQAATQG
jgi:hypothetical protein